MSAGKRYKFNGSTFSVQTALGASKTVTGITQANPGVVSSTAHGFVTGDAVELSSVSGMTQVNGKLFAVDNEVSGSFELAGTDTTGYDAFVTGSPADGIARPVTFSQFCELTGVNQQGGAADQIEVSTICSTAKEFEQGLSDSGTLSLDFNWAGLETVQAAITAANISGALLAFKVVMPGTGGIVLMFGTVTTTSFSGAVNGVWKGTASIKLSGPIFVL
ncbi:MAG: phage tail tube protein [Betaproteobacteria bacterium]